MKNAPAHAAVYELVYSCAGLLMMRRMPESSRDVAKAEQLLTKAIRTNPGKIHNCGYLLQVMVLKNDM
jgi:hypothetical protein